MENRPGLSIDEVANYVRRNGALLLVTNVTLTTAKQRPLYLQPGYRHIMVIDNGPLSPMFGPGAIAIHYSDATSLEWTVLRILEETKDCGDTRQVTLINPFDTTVDFPLHPKVFGKILRKYPQVCKFTGYRFHQPEFLRCRGRMYCLLACELMESPELYKGLRAFDGQLTLCHQTLSMRLLDILADPSVNVRCIELLYKPIEPISREYAYKCSRVQCGVFSIISSSLDRAIDLISEFMRDSQPGKILFGASILRDVNAQASLDRFFQRARLVPRLHSFGLRGLTTDEMTACSRIIANGMVHLKQCQRFMISVESITAPQAKMLTESLQTLPKLCSAEMNAKSRTENPAEQYNAFVASLKQLVRSKLCLSEVVVPTSILEDADRKMIAKLVKDNKFVRNYEPSIPLWHLMSGPAAFRPTQLFMALRGNVELIPEDYQDRLNRCEQSATAVACKVAPHVIDEDHDTLRENHDSDLRPHRGKRIVSSAVCVSDDEVAVMSSKAQSSRNVKRFRYC